MRTGYIWYARPSAYANRSFGNPFQHVEIFLAVIQKKNTHTHTQITRQNNTFFKPLSDENRVVAVVVHFAGCKINGQTVAEGQEVVASIDDRCLVCQCGGNKLSCAKKTCPILQCPKTKQKQLPNECCPRCTEQREFVVVKGECHAPSNYTKAHLLTVMLSLMFSRQVHIQQ